MRDTRIMWPDAAASSNGLVSCLYSDICEIKYPLTADNMTLEDYTGTRRKSDEERTKLLCWCVTMTTTIKCAVS